MNSALEETKSKWDIDYTIHYKYWHDDSPEDFKKNSQSKKKQLESLLPNGVTGNALDIGCGTGFTLAALQELGLHALGVDIDPGQVAASKHNGLNAQQCDDTESFLAEHTGVFSVVTMLDVLEHIPVANQIGLLRAVYKSLVPGGYFVVQVPNANSPLASRYRYIDYTHYTSFTEHSLRFVLLNAGFNEPIVPKQFNRCRPSLRLWKAEARKNFFPQFRRALVHWIWRQVMISELGDNHEARQAPLELNLVWAAQRPL